MNIDIIGPYPPPFGGVSLHISRIVPHLLAEGYTPTIWNQYGYESPRENVRTIKRSIPFMWWICFLFKKKSPIVHFHQFSILHYPYVFLLSWLSKSKVFVTLHNERLLKMPVIRRRICLFFVRNSKNLTVICASKSVWEMLCRANISDVVYLPAYVPPVVHNPRKLPGNFGYKVVFNASRVSNERDVNTYGVDLLCELALSKPNMSFFVFIGDACCAFIDNYVSSKNIENVIIIRGEPLVDYLADADLFVRLNRDDAYGVSIQEALDLDVPALASDVCERPRGCVLYQSDSYSDLLEKFNFLSGVNRAEWVNDREVMTHHIELIQLYVSKTNS